MNDPQDLDPEEEDVEDTTLIFVRPSSSGSRKAPRADPASRGRDSRLDAGPVRPAVARRGAPLAAAQTDRADKPAALTVAGSELVDGKVLARRLCLSRTTVWRLAKLGRIPYYEVGRRWLFCEREVLEALHVSVIPADAYGGAQAGEPVHQVRRRNPAG